MSKGSNESFESNEKDNKITWSEIYGKIPKLIKLIYQILTEKMNKKEENINILDFFKEIDFGIEQKEQYIMNLEDFDNENFYKYILQISIHFLKVKDNNPVNKLNPIILKHLIDLCIIFQKLLIIKDNYGKSDIKFFYIIL